jgi:hypothetical protein
MAAAEDYLVPPDLVTLLDWLPVATTRGRRERPSPLRAP